MNFSDGKERENPPEGPERLFRDLAEGSEAGFYIAQDGIFRYINTQLAGMFGYGVEELLDRKGPRDITLEEDWPAFEERLGQSAAGKGPHAPHVFRGVAKDGAVVSVEADGSRTLLQGRPAVVGTMRAATDRARAEASLREAEKKCRLVVDSSNEGIVVVRNGMPMFVNAKFEELSGFKKEELSARPFAGLFHPDDRQRVLAWCLEREAGEQGPARLYHSRLIDKSGNVKWLEIKGALCKWEGQPATVNFLSDVTERKSSREKLEEDEHRLAQYTLSLKKLLDVSKAITVTTDLRKLYRAVIATARDLLSLDFSTVMVLSKDKKQLTIEDTLGFPEAMVNTFHLVEGQGLSTYVVQNAVPGVVNDFNAEKRFEVPPVVVANRITSAACVPMMFEGEVLGVLIGHTLARRSFTEEELSIYQNIANQSAVAIENSLHLKEQQKLTAIIENTSDFIGLATLEGRTLYINAAGLALVGAGSIEEARQRNIADYVAEEDRRKLSDVMALIAHRREWKGELRFKHQTTDLTIPVELNILHIIDGETGEPVALAAIGRDLTDRKHMENELIKAQKLESLGVLAGGIAHDFNNLLTAILGNIILARGHAGPQDDVVKWLKEAERATGRAKNLTQQLLTFSRGGLPVTSVISLGSLIEEAARFTVRGMRARCEFSLPPDLWPVEADVGQIGQVINNLLINANQAMPEGGVISITGENVVLGVQAELPLEPGPYVRVSVKDTGIGIAGEHLPKIFDPYFTTKQAGSGLGLATTYSIMKKHNGHIEVESRPGAGSTFTLYVPASPGKREEEPDGAGQAMNGSGKVLVMDDDEAVRVFATDMLTFLGYEAEAAGCGEEALDAYKKAIESGVPYDAVVTDLTVPGGMGGKELIKELRAIDHQAKVIVSSGYSNDPIMANYRDYGFSGIIVKPYTDAELAKVMSAVIDRRRQGH